MKKKPNLHTLVQHVREYAAERYDDRDGWDFIVECYTDTDVANLLKENSITSKRDAIGFFRDIAGALGEQRAAARCDM